MTQIITDQSEGCVSGERSVLAQRIGNEPTHRRSIAATGVYYIVISFGTNTPHKLQLCFNNRSILELQNLLKNLQKVKRLSLPEKFSV